MRVLATIFVLACISFVAYQASLHSASATVSIEEDLTCSTLSYQACAKIPASNQKQDKELRSACAKCFPSLQFDFLAEERGLGNYLSYYYTGPVCP